MYELSLMFAKHLYVIEISIAEVLNEPNAVSSAYVATIAPLINGKPEA